MQSSIQIRCQNFYIMLYGGVATLPRSGPKPPYMYSKFTWEIFLARIQNFLMPKDAARRAEYRKLYLSFVSCSMVELQHSQGQGAIYCIMVY